MFGSITAIFGYLYPAYNTYKAAEKQRPDLEAFQFWSKYWVILAVLSVAENVIFLLTWIPFYSLFKLVFVVYLWHPRTRGVEFIYTKLVRKYVQPREVEIDRRLHEVQTRGMDLAMEYSKIGAQKVVDIASRGAAMAPVLISKAQGFASKHRNPVPAKTERDVGGDYAVVDNTPSGLGGRELRSRTGGVPDSQ